MRSLKIFVVSLSAVSLAACDNVLSTLMQPEEVGILPAQNEPSQGSIPPVQTETAETGAPQTSLCTDFVRHMYFDFIASQYHSVGEHALGRAHAEMMSELYGEGAPPSLASSLGDEQLWRSCNELSRQNDPDALFAMSQLHLYLHELETVDRDAYNALLSGPANVASTLSALGGLEPDGDEGLRLLMRSAENQSAYAAIKLHSYILASNYTGHHLKPNDLSLIHNRAIAPESVASLEVISLDALSRLAARQADHGSDFAAFLLVQYDMRYGDPAQASVWIDRLDDVGMTRALSLLEDAFGSLDERVTVSDPARCRDFVDELYRAFLVSQYRGLGENALAEEIMGQVGADRVVPYDQFDITNTVTDTPLWRSCHDLSQAGDADGLYAMSRFHLVLSELEAFAMDGYFMLFYEPYDLGRTLAALGYRGPDDNIGMRSLISAADGMSPMAVFKLHYMMMGLLGANVDDGLVEDQVHYSSAYFFSTHLLYTDGVVEASIQSLTRLAERGEDPGAPLAAFLLAQYQMGHGDRAEARIWMQRLADGGFLNAARVLEEAYEAGTIVGRVH